MGDWFRHNGRWQKKHYEPTTTWEDRGAINVKREKGFWQAYQRRLKTFASDAYEAALVVSDGDRAHAKEVYSRALTRYYMIEAGTDGRGHTVWFAWTLHRDKEGVFWTWREVHSDTKMKRDKYAHRKTKAAVAEIARKRQNAWIDRMTSGSVVAEGGDE